MEGIGLLRVDSFSFLCVKWGRGLNLWGQGSLCPSTHFMGRGEALSPNFEHWLASLICILEQDARLALIYTILAEKEHLLYTFY